MLLCQCGSNLLCSSVSCTPGILSCVTRWLTRILFLFCSSLLHRFRDAFLASMAGVQRHLLRHSQPSQLMFVGEEMESRQFYAKMASCTSIVLLHVAIVKYLTYFSQGPLHGSLICTSDMCEQPKNCDKYDCHPINILLPGLVGNMARYCTNVFSPSHRQGKTLHTSVISRHIAHENQLMRNLLCTLLCLRNLNHAYRHECQLVEHKTSSLKLL